MEETVHSIGIAKSKQKTGSVQRILICIYFLISFFEPYLNGALGSITKYYIFLLIGILCLSHRKLKIQSFHWCFLAWLIYKWMTVLWTPNTYIFNLHVLSQIGMIALLVVLTAIPLDQKTIDCIVNTMWFGSFTIGFLSLFMSRPYHGIATTRQVLYLFGQEADPNNQAAFLLLGLAIALYHLIFEKKHIVLSVVTVAVNAYSLFLTGSRGGLVGLVCIGIVLLFTSAKGEKIGSRFRLAILIALLGIALYFLAAHFLPEDIFLRLFSFETYEGGSERDIIWKNGWELLTSGLNFLFGAGWGAYYGYNGIYSAIHNTFLSMLCDVGLIGFALFFAPILKVCFDFLKHKNVLPVLLLVCGFIPSFFLDAINKRFFWNVIFILFIYYCNMKPVASSQQYPASYSSYKQQDEDSYGEKKTKGELL